VRYCVTLVFQQLHLNNDISECNDDYVNNAKDDDDDDDGKIVFGILQNM
jgi:hypothetical protein